MKFKERIFEKVYICCFTYWNHLKTTNNITVDLHLDTSKEYCLRGVLFMMIEFIEKKHEIEIKIKPISNKHVVLDLNHPKDKK